MRILYLLLFFQIFLSCKKEVVDQKKQPQVEPEETVEANKKVKFSINRLDINDSNDTVFFEIEGDDIKFEFINSNDWVAIKELDKNKYNLIIEGNETNKDRFGIVYLSDENNKLMDSLKIHQSHLEVYLHVDIEKVFVDKIQPKFDFFASSNLEIEINNDFDWFEIINTEDSLYTILFKNNHSKLPREGIVEISTVGRTENIFKTIKISQSADYGRYSDSIAIQNLNRNIDFIGYNTTNTNRPWPSSVPLQKLKYIDTEVINNEVRVVAIQGINYLSRFNINLGDSIKLLSQLKKIGIAYGIKGNDFFEKISKNTEIEEIIISNASVSGNFDSLHKLKKLKVLKLFNTSIGGQFQNNIQELKDLEVIELATTNLNGALPEGFYNLSSLDTLNLKGVNLTGNLSPDIVKLKNLRYLQLVETLQKGTLPDNIGSMQKLNDLVLMRVEFEGEMPKSIGNLSNLKRISIEDTKMFGEIPSTIQNLKNLNSLNLRQNRFSGEIFEYIYELQNLNTIMLEFNNFSGKIDSRIRNLKDIIDFRVSGNSFSGTIPKEFAEYPMIWNFRCNDNMFTGVFPQELMNYHRFNSWNAKQHIFPQKRGYGFSNIL